MTTKLLTVYSCDGPICGTVLPADVIICIPFFKVVAHECSAGIDQPYQYGYILGEVVEECKVNGKEWKFTISYDDAQVDGTLYAGEVEGIACVDCIARYADQRAGNEIRIDEDEAGLQTLVTQHGCEYLIDPPILSSFLIGTDDVGVILSEYDLITGMTVTPIEGLYWVSFSASGRITGDANAVGEYGIFVAGVLEANSHRDFSPRNVDVDATLHTQAIVQLSGAQTLTVEYLTSGGTFTVHERSLSLIKLA